MKKILSIALVLCMMLSVCVVSVGATGEYGVDFVVGEAEVVAGESFTIDVNITSNTGFAIANFVFVYDKTVMTLTNITNHSTLGMLPNVAGDRALFDASAEYTGTGKFMTLTFETVPGATGSYDVSVAMLNDEPPMSWELFDYIDYTVTAGKVSFKAAYPFTGSNIALGEKFAINVKYNATANDVITVTSEGEDVAFTAANGQVTIANIDAKSVDKVFDVTINGYTESFSVAAYCEAQKDSTDAELAAVATAVLDYNKAANNYFEGAGETLEVPHCDVGTDNPRVVANATEGPTFYSVRLQLNDGVYVVVRMQNYTEGDTVTVTIGGVAATYTIGDVNGMAGIFIPVKADQYDADIVITAGNSTLTYSVNTYIQQKQNSGDADLVNLVNALGHYGKAVAAYAAA